MNSVSLGVMLLVKVLLCTNAGREVVDPACKGDTAIVFVHTLYVSCRECPHAATEPGNKKNCFDI